MYLLVPTNRCKFFLVLGIGPCKNPRPHLPYDSNMLRFMITLALCFMRRLMPSKAGSLRIKERPNGGVEGTLISRTPPP